MEFFHTIYDFYRDRKFFDLKIKSGKDGQEIWAHTLVIGSAIPGLSQALSEHYNERIEEETTLLFPDISGSQLEQVVAEIYSSLVQESEVELDKISFWAESFCSSENVRKNDWDVSTRGLKRRKVSNPEFEAAGFSKYGGKRSRGVVKNLKAVPKQVPTKDESNYYISAEEMEVKIFALKFKQLFQ